ncbi:MAG: hypothetical protein FJ266_07285 [Planctomycetes bacterium]|nr:hypothetical protein [Planctomycetota bacterium]
MRNCFKMAVYGVLVIGIMGIGVSTLFAFSGGPPDGRTGSPADNLLTCNDGCHNNYDLNSGLAAFSISAPASYTPGETLSVSVSFGNSSTAKHGFELSALDTNNNHVGTFSSVEGDGNTQTNNGDYIKHTSAGSSQSGNASWNVNWTAPADGQGVVTFYAAGNEANGDGTNQGDYIYTTTKQISTAVATPTATPTPTTTECEPEAITLDTKKLNLKLGEGKTVTVTVSGADDCKSEGATVNAVIKTGKNRVAIDATTATTDANGQATFTITAGQKKGNSKVVFTVEDSEGEVYTTFVIVKIRKK